MANVLFTRKNASEIPNVPITDGQLIFDTSGNGKMYLDNGTDRLEMGGAVTVDASLSKTSTNAVQNKAVTGNILNSLAEVSAATQQNTIAGALALKEVNSSLGGCEFSVESDGAYVTYTVGADTVKKKLGSVERTIIAENATNGTYSVVDLLDNYADLTADNFIFVATKVKTWGSYKNSGKNWNGTNNIPSKEAEVSLSYNALTGDITLSNCSISNTHSGQAGVGGTAVGQVYGTIYYYQS